MKNQNEMQKLLESNKTGPEVAQELRSKFGCDHDTIRRMLIRAGFTLTPFSTQWRNGLHVSETRS
mgnify:CR=1 FL=1